MKRIRGPLAALCISYVCISYVCTPPFSIASGVALADRGMAASAARLAPGLALEAGGLPVDGRCAGHRPT